MAKKQRKVISCSRRTDIPTFHYNWLQNHLENGFIDLKKGKKIEKISLSPEDIHSIVLWSKNFNNVLKDPKHLVDFNLFFQYTITHYSKALEPNVPDYNETLKILDGLLKKYRPEQFNIRFDPIILSTIGEINPTPNKPGLARLQVFEQLCKDLKSLGMDNCRLTTSYITMYGQVENNMKNIDVTNLSSKLQTKFMERMVEIADKYNRTIYSCSTPILTEVPSVQKSACIDGELLSSLFNVPCSATKDTAQRQTCGCTKSIDIGDYDMPCYHKCTYCYSRASLFK